MTERKPNVNEELDRMPEQERIRVLLRSAMPAIAAEAEPSRDLWPDVLRRIDRDPLRVPWFDWALAAGLVALVAVFPTAVPVMLYYL